MDTDDAVLLLCSDNINQRRIERHGAHELQREDGRYAGTEIRSHLRNCASDIISYSII